jgi:hypothetical protein
MEGKTDVQSEAPSGHLSVIAKDLKYRVDAYICEKR